MVFYALEGGRGGEAGLSIVQGQLSYVSSRIPSKPCLKEVGGDIVLVLTKTC